MPVERTLWFVEEEIIANPDKIYVFGDNVARKGRGGQAKPCRDKPNTLGVRTKRTPGTEASAYWHDDTFIENVKYVTEDFKQIEKLLKKGRTLVFPLDGFGTGLAELRTNAPQTLRFIELCSDYCIRRYGKDVHKEQD